MLDFQAFAVLIIASVGFVAFANDRIPLQLTSLLLIAALALLFQIFPITGERALTGYDMFFGFGHPALAAVCALMVLGHALVVTGALDPLARVLARLLSWNRWIAGLAVLLTGTGMSLLLNDTPVVVLMIPILVNAALRSGSSAITTLMPMNFAVLIGGTATTIGTSTNLLVTGIAKDLGVRSFNVFDFTPLVLTAAIPAILYLWLIAPRLLARRDEGANTVPRARRFEAAMIVEEKSWLIERTRAEVEKRMPSALRILRVTRAGLDLEATDDVSFPLAAGDMLHLLAPAGDLKEMESTLGLSFTHEQQVVLLPTGEDQLAEVTLTGSSSWIGSTARAMRLLDKHGVALLALHRPAPMVSELLHDDPADVPLRAGDVLLLQGGSARLAALSHDPSLLMLDGRVDLPHTRKAVFALGGMVGTVVLAATGVLPIAISALFAVGMLLATRTIGLDAVGRALKTEVVLIIAASLALGRAFTGTGLDQEAAALIVSGVQGLSPAGVVALLMAVTAVLTNFVTNNAAAAIATPIAVAMASSLGIPAEALVLAVLFGCNLSYATPMAYQSNLLVMSAANYRFSDFVRVGVPLALIMLVALTYELTRRYGLA